MALVAALGWPLLAHPAEASVDPTGHQQAAPTAQLSGETRPLHGKSARGFIAWPGGRRGFTFSLGSSLEPANGWPELLAFDLDTWEEVGRTDLHPRGYAPSGYHEAIPHVLGLFAIDHERGELYVPYGSPGIHAVGLTDPAVRAEYTAGAGQGRPCANTALALLPANCFAGFHVVNGTTLGIVRELRYRPVQADGSTAAPLLRAVSFSPPRRGAEGDTAKVQALVEEHVLNPLGGTSSSESVRTRAATITYLVQFNAETGVQEWTVRLEGCRRARETHENNPTSRAEPWPAAIVRSGTPENSAIYVACHAGSKQQGVVVRLPVDESGTPDTLPVRVSDPVGAGSDSVDDQRAEAMVGTAGPAPAVLTFSGPEGVSWVLPDPLGEQILLKVIDGNPLAEVWWIFDLSTNEYIGTVGIGATGGTPSPAGFDAANGRLYVSALPHSDSPGGLFVADVRQRPLGQALFFPDAAIVGGNPRTGVIVDAGEGFTRLFVEASDRYHIIDDRLPLSGVLETGNWEGKTLDLEEVENVTGVSLDGTARAYGARALLVGGVEAVARVGILDPVGSAIANLEAIHQGVDQGATKGALALAGMPFSTACLNSNREFVLGFVGPAGSAVVDADGGRGSATAVLVDSGTAADQEALVSRCAPIGWDRIWSQGLFARPPVGEPRVEYSPHLVECVAAGEETAERSGDPILSTMAAGVQCSEGEASGFGYARGSEIGPLSVGEALASFRIYRDPGRGIVARVESVARGLNLLGTFTIDTVRGSAESWANGRKNAVKDADRESNYEPNCDLERTAGTCFQRHVFGVRSPAYSCGPCGDEARLIDGLNRALGANGRARFRDPDPVLANGAENGYIAAITKPEGERFADLVLSNDLLQTVVPSLEILRYAPPSRAGLTSSAGGVRGRQIYQFAGVEVSSSYSIQCLLVYDEESNTCAAPAEEPGAITVSLQDGDGEPLAGGAFEVRQDVDADGVLGLVDTLLPDGACVTAEDGVGTCSFEDLQPGSYLVSQVAAPPGYAKSDEPFVVELASGEARTVAFTNVSNVSTIELTAQDENGGPLEGATFAAYPDPDSDGKVAPEAQPAATCTTGADGTCTMRVPAGSYVLVQTAVPGGLEGIEPVPFTFASGGQVAAVTITNYPPLLEGPPPAASPDVTYTPPVDVAPPVESIDPGYTPPAEQPEVASGETGVIGQVGGTVVQVIRAPGDALRLLSRDPKQAVAWIAALALFCLAVMAIRRRQQAMALLQH